MPHRVAQAFTPATDENLLLAAEMIDMDVEELESVRGSANPGDVVLVIYVKKEK